MTTFQNGLAETFVFSLTSEVGALGGNKELSKILRVWE